MPNTWKITFEVDVVSEHKQEYWKATVPGFPVFMYGESAQEAEGRAIRGLSVLLESYMDSPNRLEQYLQNRKIEYQAFTEVGSSGPVVEKEADSGLMPDAKIVGEYRIGGWIAREPSNVVSDAVSTQDYLAESWVDREPKIVVPEQRSVMMELQGAAARG